MFFRSFFLTCRSSATVAVTVAMLRALLCPRLGPRGVYPLLFSEITQVQILDQDGVITVYVSAREARAVSSVMTALRERGLTGVRVEGVRTEDVQNRTRMREGYSLETLDMLERLAAANRDNVVSFVGPSVKVDLFGNRQWGAGLRRQRSLASSRSSLSPSVSASTPSSPVSNPGEGPVPSHYSPRYEPRSPYVPETPPYSPRSPEVGSAVPRWAFVPAQEGVANDDVAQPAVVQEAAAPVVVQEAVAVQEAAAPAPFANDPPHVIALRAFLNAHGAEAPDFGDAIERFALAQLRATVSPLAQELLGVMEHTGEPFVRDFAAYLNTHRGDHTHAEFQTRLDAFVLAYIERLHPNSANYNFAMRMFFAFQSGDHRDAFGEVLARIAGGVSLVD
jgi:hypothetical protein